MRRPLVAGNWKMNGSLQQVSALLAALDSLALPDTVDVAVFPSMPHLILAADNR